MLTTLYTAQSYVASRKVHNRRQRRRHSSIYDTHETLVQSMIVVADAFVRHTAATSVHRGSGKPYLEGAHVANTLVQSLNWCEHAACQRSGNLNRLSTRAGGNFLVDVTALW